MLPPTLSAVAAGRTHVGLVKRRNEDAMYFGRFLFAVADGLGGHVAGDVASGTAITALRPYDRAADPDELADVLGQAVSEINAALRTRVAAEKGLAGMATTLVAMLLSGDQAVLANVGDSRAYLLRRQEGSGELKRLTEDHTYRHLVADAGTVPNLPERLARFLDGRTDGRSPDLTPLRLAAGDRYLLCSDGLSSYVPRQLIHAAAAADHSPDVVADRLVTLALDHGGPDNVTVLVVDINDAHPTTAERGIRQGAPRNGS